MGDIESFKRIGVAAVMVAVGSAGAGCGGGEPGPLPATRLGHVIPNAKVDEVAGNDGDVATQTQAILGKPLMKWLEGDFDGDGRTDLMKLWPDAGAMTADVHLATGARFGILRWATRQGGHWDDQKWMTGDFNGDGRTDLMKLWPDAGAMTADVHLSTGSQFVMSRWATRQGGYSVEQRWTTGDFNGDGRTDLMKFWDDAGAMTADVHLSTGSAFTMQRWATRQGGYSLGQQWMVGDFDGDFRSDLMKLWQDNGAFTADVHLSTGSAFTLRRWATRQGGFPIGAQWLTGDFNGDWKTDVMKLWDDGGSMTADVHLSSGAAFTLQRWATKQGGIGPLMSWVTGDFNGDWKTDLAKSWDDAGAMSADVHLSSGAAFGMQRWATKQGGYWRTQSWTLGDFDGNGKTDLAKHWDDAGSFTCDVHLARGTLASGRFEAQRWATRQGGYW